MPCVIYCLKFPIVILMIPLTRLIIFFHQFLVHHLLSHIGTANCFWARGSASFSLNWMGHGKEQYTSRPFNKDHRRIKPCQMKMHRSHEKNPSSTSSGRRLPLGHTIEE